MSARVIKRYRNRRLYDTETSRTITHDDLAELIKEGHSIQVIDTATGDDITLSVLGRVMLSESHSWTDLKESKELIREIIYHGGDKSMSVLKNTILASIGALEVTKQKAEKIIDELIKRGEVNKSDRKKAVMELVEKAEKSTEGWREKVIKEYEKNKKKATDYASDLNWARQNDVKKLETKVNKLAKQVKELEAQVGKK